MFCHSCGAALEANAKFCADCGQRVDDAPTPVAEKATAPSIDVAKITKDASEKVKSLGSGVVKSFNAKPKRNYSIAAGLFLLLAYGVIQLAMLQNSGPQQLANKYIAAVASGSNTALSDETLFPNPDGLEMAPMELAPDADATGKIQTSLFSNDASIALVSPYGTSIGKIKLKAEDHWNFIFRTRSWKIVSPGSSITLGQPDVEPTQGFAYGSIAFKNPSDKNFGSFLGKKYLAMPGVYSTSTDSYGFNAASIDTVIVGAESTLTLAPAKATSFSVQDDQTAEATAKAEAKQKACVKSQCGAMPTFAQPDYYFASEDPADDYYFDESYSSKSYSADGCTLSSSEAVSALKATFTFDCDVSSDITVTHVITYYFLSDDYSYFYGTASDTMSINVTMVFDPKTGKFKLS